MVKAAKYGFALLLFWAMSPAWTMAPSEIIEKVDALMNPEARVMLRLTFKKNGRVDESYEMKTYARDNNQKVIVRFTAPASSIGNDLIMLDRNVWMYQQNAGRTLRVPANLAFGDTGFSYGDIVRLNLKDNYNATLASETDKEWVLDLTAKDRQSPYHRIQFTVAKGSFVPVKAVALSGAGQIIKTIEYKAIKNVNGRDKPTELFVTSPLSPDEESTMTYEAETPMVLAEQFFNRQNLALRLEEHQ
ncbi:MAG TPA: outer membrane lipoprotein-sorting protein [Candidatus Competibacter sp.]|nr:outer membrane lipoprotein-sorting protein [Candidatus Competibacter sp.]